MPQIARRFPMYLKHRDARCYACANFDRRDGIQVGEALTDLHPSGHAPGQGAYRGKCPKCFQHTWYDCAEGSVEMIDENERAAGRGKTSPKTT